MPLVAKVTRSSPGAREAIKAILAIAAQPDVRHGLGLGTDEGASHMMEFSVEMLSTSDPQHINGLWLICSDDGLTPVGFVAIHRMPASYELSYVVSSQHRGHGYASRGAAAVLAQVACIDPGVVVRARVRQDNPASLAVAARLGFEHTGFVRHELLGDGTLVAGFRISLGDVLARPETLPTPVIEHQMSTRGMGA